MEVSAMAPKYDVFISYSSNDRAWALKLAESLKAFDVFLDQRELEAGKPWNTQLQQSIQASKHLLVLWSDHAKASTWVWREISDFDAKRVNDGTATGAPRLIFLKLQGDIPAYSDIQAIEDLKQQNSYAAGPENVPIGLWENIVGKLVSAIGDDDASVAIPLVILTLTRKELEELTAGEWAELSQDLGLSKEQLLPLYGPTRADWRPFGSPNGVLNMLNGLKDQINESIKLNKQMREVKFRWERPPESFWEDIAEAKKFKARFMSDGLSLLVIDPVAIHKQSVYKRLMHFQDCYGNSSTAILVLPPFAMPQSNRRLREWLRNHGTPYFDPYYEPTLLPKNRLSAQCGFNIGDEEDIRRVLLTTVGNSNLGRGPSARSPYTEV
jgi:hypothetical protein